VHDRTRTRAGRDSPGLVGGRLSTAGSGAGAAAGAVRRRRSV